jgi:hypothetical protein
MNRKNKHGQEEMVGFVLIVVLVAVIAVIFLGISLRSSDSGSSESLRLGSFLSTVSEVTTQCEIPTSNIKNLGQLVIRCVELDKCEGSESNPDRGKFACTVLEESLKEIMELSYPVAEGSFVSSYNLMLLDDSDELIIEPIVAGNIDNCLGSKLTNSKQFSRGLGQGNIIMSLDVCFNQ